MAELDLIEVVERTKDDYESDVEESVSPDVASDKGSSSQSESEDTNNCEQALSDRCVLFQVLC